MSIKIKFIAMMIFANSCSNNNSSSSIQNNRIENPNNVISIFRASENDNSFKLIINDKLFYNDSVPSSITDSPGTYIGKIKRGKQDSFKIYLKIDNEDTLILYNTKGIDSLLLGRKIPKKGFYIVTNLQKGSWLSE